MKIRKIAALALAFAAISTVALAAGVAEPTAVPAIDWMAFAQTYIFTPAAISGACSLLAAILPQGAPGTPWGIIRIIVDFAASNWGNAANKPKV